jgi:hypothetical protein
MVDVQTSRVEKDGGSVEVVPRAVLHGAVGGAREGQGAGAFLQMSTRSKGEVKVTKAIDVEGAN